MKELDRFRKFLREDKKSISGGMLLSENTPGYDDRKFGKPLPTLESVQAAHEAKVKESEDYLGNFEYQIFGSEYDFKTSQEMGSDPMEIYYDAYLDAGPKDEMIALAKQYADKAPNEKFIVVHEDDWFDEIWSSDAEVMDKKERRAGVNEDIQDGWSQYLIKIDPEEIEDNGWRAADMESALAGYYNLESTTFQKDNNTGLPGQIEVTKINESINEAHKHTYKQIDPDGTAECTKCGLRNSDPSKTGEKVRAGVRSAAEKLGMKPSHIRENYTDEEMLVRIKVSQLPDDFSLLDVIEQYKDHVVGYLRDYPVQRDDIQGTISDVPSDEEIQLGMYIDDDEWEKEMGR